MKDKLQALRDKLFGKGGEEGLSSFRSLFERFRDLLDANNDVLALIADMGDKLSGDYVFDTRYLENTASELEVLVRRIIDDLNVITGDRYPELNEAFERIRREVRAEMDDDCWRRQQDLVVPLERADLDRIELVGGKMGTLGEVRSRLGLRVPPGFVVTTTAYRAFISQDGVADFLSRAFADLEAGAGVEEMSRRIRSYLAGARLPEKLDIAIVRAASRMAASGYRFFAVRSSAVEEDGCRSFAGQYRSYLQVPVSQLGERYKDVVASLFTPEAIVYRGEHGLAHNDSAMAVGFLAMVDPEVSGVLYSRDPEAGEQPVMLVSAAWGLARTVVDGSSGTDFYRLDRDGDRPGRVIERRIAKKETEVRPRESTGERQQAVPEDRQARPCLTPERLERLSEVGEQLEAYFRSPQDVEWCFDGQDVPIILQSRPLRVRTRERIDPARVAEAVRAHAVLMEDAGMVACRGIGAGRVTKVLADDDFDRFQRGAVLVARSSSPKLSRLIPLCAAIVTDIGTPTGHMATVAREYRVPTLVDTGRATEILEEGMEVTVDAEEQVIYKGVVKKLLHFQTLVDQPFADAREFRVLRRLLKRISPLYLTDPKARSFSAENCRTYHDITRFCHEMAVKEFIDFHLRGGPWRRIPTHRLELAVPLGLVVIDIGGGIREDVGKRVVKPEHIVSRPLRALLDGLCAEGVWRTRPVDIDFRSFMSSFTKMSHLDTMDPGEAQNLAVISRDYMNVNLRLGYHFNMIDALMSDNRNDNYVYFRFMGGVTDAVRRSRRARFLAEVLAQHDYLVEVKGDLVVARVRKIRKAMMHDSLVMVGRLLGFARQLDVLMKSDETVARYVREFLDDEASARSALQKQGGNA